MLGTLCPDTARLLVASMATHSDLEGLAALGACAREWQRRVVDYLEEVRAELQRAALDFRRSFARLPLCGAHIAQRTKALDCMLQRFGVTGAMRVNVCAKLWQSGTAVGVFDTVPMLMTLLARARREAASSSLTVLYIWHASRDVGDGEITPPRMSSPAPPLLNLKLLHHAVGRGFRRPYVLLKRRARPARLLLDRVR